MKKKNITVPVVALSLICGGMIMSAESVHANENYHTKFAQRFSERFNVNENTVREFLETDHKERRFQAQERFEERLVNAVQNGELTEDQKNLIIAKKTALQSDRGTYRETGERPSEDERENHYKDLASWAEQNNIDMTHLVGGRGYGQHNK
jgi:hypothetical protein